MTRATPSILLALLLAGCKEKAPPRAVTTNADAASSASAPTSSAVPSTSTRTALGALPVGLPTTKTEALRDASASRDQAVHVVVGVDGGAVEIWAREAKDPHGGGSDIVGQRRDADGARIGGPRLLRRTSGNVVGLASARVSGEVWFGWTSQLANDTTFSAVARVDATLGQVAKPTTLLHTKTHEVFADGATTNRSILVAPRADGSGVLVATLANSGKTKCFLPNAGALCNGLGWVVFAVSASEGARLLGGDLLDGGPSVSIAALLDAGDAVFASAWTWHGGAVVHHVRFPSEASDAGATPMAALPAPRPPYRASWDGNAIVLHAPADHWDATKRGACPRPNEPDLCEQVAIARPDATTKFVPVKERRETCGNGHAAITLLTTGESAKLSTRAGTVPELAGWTGKVLLDVDPSGQLVKRRCENGTLAAPTTVD